MTIKNKLYLLVFLIFAFLTNGYGQLEHNMISPKSMKKDFKAFLKLLDAHPALYANINEADFQASITDVKKQIEVEMDELDFYKNLSKIVSLIGDGHSNVYMPKYWLKNMQREHGAFPYEVYLNNAGELYVIKSFGDTKITLGSQILEINGMPIDTFVKKVTPYLSFETIPFRNDQISESFEFLLYLVFKQADNLSFKVKLATESTVVVNTIPYRSWLKQFRNLREEREKKIADDKPFDFEILKPGIAKISIFSFMVPSLNRYKVFLFDTFKEIRNKNIHSLIIDVRGNYGGWPKVSSKLFHYIHDGPFKTMAKSSMKISQPFRKSITDSNPGINSGRIRFTARRHYVDIQAVLFEKINSYVTEAAFFNEAEVEEEYEFKGDCYLLIDRKSYSASSSFASTFQCYSMGILIGEPTGGTKIFSANPFTQVLTKSGMIFRTSTTKMFSTCYNLENEPVLPNVEVSPTILDLIHESDSQQNVAIRLIQKMQKEKAASKQ